MPVITASITDKINIADVNTIPAMYKGPSFIMELHNIIVIQSSTSNEKENITIFITSSLQPVHHYRILQNRAFRTLPLLYPH